MKDAPRITGVTVVLDDGRWQHFTAADIAVVRDFAGTVRVWQLLEFMTSLAPEPLPVPQEPAQLEMTGKEEKNK